MALLSNEAHTPGRGHEHCRRRPGLLMLLILLACPAVLIQATAHAKDAAYGEYELKAVFLYHLMEFVHWPSNAFADEDAPIKLGVLGEEDPFGPLFEEQLESRTRQGRRLLVTRSRQAEDLGGCQVIFVTHSAKQRVEHILDTFSAMPVLTIGELEDFARKGGIVNLKIVDNKVRIEINREAAERVGLKLSGRLLKTAMIVRTEHAQEAHEGQGDDSRQELSREGAQ